MFAILFGAACLAGLIWMGTRGHRHHWHQRALLYRAFERLETTPGQEKVIRNVVNELKRDAGDAHRSLGEWRQELARAMRGNAMDSHSLESLFARQDEDIRRLRDRAADALASVHDTLDEEQRERFASWIEKGRSPGFRGCHHPYRSLHERTAA